MRTRPTSTWLGAILVVCLWSAGWSQAQALGTADPVPDRVDEPIVIVAAVDGPIDGQVEAVIDIPTSPSAVWSVLTDCIGAPAFLPNLRECSIIEAAPDGSSDVREHRVASWASFLPDMRSVFRSDYVVERSITFQRTAGDLEHLEGTWSIRPIEGGAATRVTYLARVGFNPFVPGFLVRRSLASSVPAFLKTIRDEAIRRAL